jgi:A/G-specific adenine glycosylase
MAPKERIADLLMDWYRKNAREYPWRKNRTPYRILIAEIMLQRTKADQVAPVYLSFLKEFPDPERLRQASKEEIMKYFSKLGLIRRAGLVELLGKELLARFEGKIPRNREDLMSLPSVGEYMADAVLCFAFDEDVAVVDSNVCRIIGRIFDLKAKGEARRDAQFRQAVNGVLPSGKAKEFNWAIIDLGALICTPRNPSCNLCPLRPFMTLDSLGKIEVFIHP